MAPKKLGVKGLTIHSQTREIVNNVSNFMKKEAEEGIQIPLTRYRERVLQATGISRGSYQKIRREGKKVERADSSASFTTPRKRRPRRGQVIDHVTEGAIEQIRRIIYDFVIIEKQRPTLKCILQKIKDSELGFSGGKTTLWKLLKKMGFRWKNAEDKRKVLVESYDIRLKRVNYFKKILEYRREKRPIVYTDETYIHSSHTQSKEWYDESAKGLQTPMSKGQRLIIVHAGGDMGFIEDGLLIFKSGAKAGDYHEDMNHSNFMQWVRTQLLPNLPENSVLVIDNASYHNVKTEASVTTATKKAKADMIRWLQERNIVCDETMTKVELYSIIKDRRSQDTIRFKLDDLLEANGHHVVRLPRYHPKLNPIEKIWTTVKNWVAKRNVTFKIKDVEELARQKFGGITVDEWQTICTHVEKIERKYMETEHLLDEADDSLRFYVGEESSNDTDYETESEDFSGIEPMDSD